MLDSKLIDNNHACYASACVRFPTLALDSEVILLLEDSSLFLAFLFYFLSYKFLIIILVHQTVD